MLKTKTITTDKATLLVVELLPKIKPETIRFVDGTMFYYDHIGRDGISVPKGNWQLLGRLPEISEEQAELIVPEDYHSHIKAFAKWYWALMVDFLKDNDVYFENPLGQRPVQSRERIKLFGTFYYINRNAIELDKWQEAQSKVFDKERTYLFIKED